MQKYNLNYQVNALERLFIDKSIESLYFRTLDSYRLRLHNPKTLIQELISVIYDSMSGVLTNNDYLNATTKELKKMLSENTDALTFNSISKKHFMDNLDKKPSKANSKLLQQSSRLILKYNTNYLSTIIREINSILESYTLYFDYKNNLKPGKNNDYHTAQKKLIVLTDYLYIELLSIGFSKQYIYNIFQSVFIFNRSNTNFDIQLSIFYQIINKQPERFLVIFSLNDSSFKFNEFHKIDNKYILVDKIFKNKIRKNLSQEGVSFLEKDNTKTFIGIYFETRDYFKAVQFAVDKISKDLDVYHLGYNNKHYRIEKQCLTIGDNDPSKASTVPSNFQIDGYFKSNSSIFNNLLHKIQSLKTNNIDEDSYQKILSAIRYYRTGSESSELENKFLNYWIGLEFIFNSYNSEEKTIDRIRRYLPKCHSLIYVKRNLFDYHRTLSRLELSRFIDNFDDNLLYLTNNISYNNIILNANNELIKFRTDYFRKWYQEPNKITNVLFRHNSNIEWNITRLYRIRNEIVHNAAIKTNIYTHISHLKYYLSFILNSILDYMSENDIDLDNDGKITIDDFFISQEIILGCLNGEKLEKWLAIKNPNQIFQ